jgi:hypothetical protein
MASWRFQTQLKKDANADPKDIEFANALMEMYSQRKLGSFYVKTDKWRQSIVKRGLTLFFDARDALQIQK